MKIIQTNSPEASTDATCEYVSAWGMNESASKDVTLAVWSSGSVVRRTNEVTLNVEPDDESPRVGRPIPTRYVGRA